MSPISRATTLTASHMKLSPEALLKYELRLNRQQQSEMFLPNYSYCKNFLVDSKMAVTVKSLTVTSPQANKQNTRTATTTKPI